MVAKTDDEIYVLNTIKLCSYFSFTFSDVLKNIDSDVATLKMVAIMQNWQIRRE